MPSLQMQPTIGRPVNRAIGRSSQIKGFRSRWMCTVVMVKKSCASIGIIEQSPGQSTAIRPPERGMSWVIATTFQSRGMDGPLFERIALEVCME